MELSALVAAAPVAILVASRDGTVRFSNPAATALIGGPPGAATGPLLRWVDPQDSPGWRRALAVHPKRGPSPVEVLSFTYQEDGEEMTAIVARPPEALASDALIRTAAHDLIEPIRVVGSYTSLIERRYAARLDEDAKQFLGFTAGAASRMENVVEGLVSLARLRAEPPRFEVCDSGACASDALASLSREVEERGAEVHVGDLPTLLADHRRLTRLFGGLLDNALKFSRDAPRVTIDASQAGDAWLFSVTDNGIGIDEHHRDRVFEPFTRLHPVGTYAGAGVGLATCREIVESHAGRIWVEGADGGSRFRFTIPRFAMPKEEKK